MGLLSLFTRSAWRLSLNCSRYRFSAQAALRLSYKGRELRQRYIPDFACYEKIILEIKAVTELTDEHRAQLINYLKATGYRLGLLVNFGHHPKLEYERFIV
jgi:GxxExxY protein